MYVYFRKSADKLMNELSMARMKGLSESQRVLELERKLFAAENILKQGQSDSIKLHVQIEELQMKYESKGNHVPFQLQINNETLISFMI